MANQPSIKQQQVYLSENIRLELKAIAKEERKSMSLVAEEAIKELIRKRNKQKIKLDDIADLARRSNG